VPAWLARRVGPDGEVLATDIDVRWLRGDGFEVRRHDVATDPGQFATSAMVTAWGRRPLE
jgi:hypothetical protein